MYIEGLSPTDPGSHSRPDQVIVKHMNIKLDCDFDNHLLKGEVALSIQIIKPNASSLLLDTRDLTILNVTNGKGVELKFDLGYDVLSFGRKLYIYLPPSDESECLIIINYITSSNASALQWLSPEQTAGKKFPYLFTQCQPDHCRSIIPCQDTPYVKTTFEAEITAPESLMVLMSAIRYNDDKAKLTENGKKMHRFKQEIPVPAYLIALVVGNLESRKLGPRSSVWSEPEIVDSAAYEFAETDLLLKTAEEICGPYVWKIYDILVLPPSFPFGGMENPCLTFITPTILAGDRSLVSVIAHEISHSWTGNLVSIKNFEHFWLNEGFTMFIERKINGRLKGELYRQFDAIGGLKDMYQAIKVFAEKKSLTKLVVNLKGVDPDEAFSTIPYEKGHSFLFYLEQLLGGPEKFEPFLRSYFETFKYKSIVTDDFKNYLCHYFSDNEKIGQIEWDQWLFTPGMPYIIPDYDKSLQNACVNLFERWVNWDLSDPTPFSTDDLKSLLIEQVQEFIALLLELDSVSLEKVKHMDSVYNLSCYKNSEIRYRWLRLCIKARWVEKVDAAFEFANGQGRMKYTRPLYRDLYGWEEMRDRTVEEFKKHKNCMMYVLIKSLENDLHMKEPEAYESISPD